MKENMITKGMPHSDSSILSMCGSIVDKVSIYNGVRLKENTITKGMPHIDSFNLSICGSITDKSAICKGYKDG